MNIIPTHTKKWAKRSLWSWLTDVLELLMRNITSCRTRKRKILQISLVTKKFPYRIGRHPSTTMRNETGSEKSVTGPNCYKNEETRDHPIWIIFSLVPSDAMANQLLKINRRKWSLED